MASQNFNRIFATSETQQHVHTDAIYQLGWNGIVNQEPPRKSHFNAIHRELDLKAQESYLRSRFVWVSSFTYNVDDVVREPGTGVFKKCVLLHENVFPSNANTTHWTDQDVFGGTGAGGNAPGQVIMSGSPIPPQGTLACIGQTVSQATFPDLFAAIGSIFNDNAPATPGSTPAGQFRLPFMSDVHVAGYGGDGTIGQRLEESPGHHTHAMPRLSSVNVPNWSAFNTGGSGGGVSYVPNNFAQHASDHVGLNDRVYSDVVDLADDSLRPTTINLAFFIAY